MKTITLLLVLVCCFASVGCKGPVEEVRAFINEKLDVVGQMCKTIDENPTAAGIDDARKILEARKGDLITKRETFRGKTVTGYRDDMLLMLANSDVSDNNIFEFVRKKHFFQFAIDKAGNRVLWDMATDDKFHALIRDYKAIVKGMISSEQSIRGGRDYPQCGGRMSPAVWTRPC